MSAMTKDQYIKYVDRVSPTSSLLKNVILAFISGGLICDLGQFFYNYCMSLGMDIKTSAEITTITMIFLGALLTGLGVYDYIGKFAGAGSIVPITGFANSIVSPAMEFRTEGFVFGVGGKMFTIAGPVLVYGIISSWVIGIIYYLFGTK